MIPAHSKLGKEMRIHNNSNSDTSYTNNSWFDNGWSYDDWNNDLRGEEEEEPFETEVLWARWNQESSEHGSGSNW